MNAPVRMLRCASLAVLLVMAACSSDDAAPPDAAPADAPPADAMSADAAPLPSEPYACGPSLTCETTQYCSETLPGVCGGTPTNPDGSCPMGCTPCPSETECACNSYSCSDIPDGCRDCACLGMDTPGNACQCTWSSTDGILVQCAAP